MKKVSVKAASGFHRPVFYGALPRDPPRPLCGLIRMGEDPEWSPLDHLCDACDRLFEHNNRKKAIKLQIEMEI